jgi:hypothetical protein
MRQSETVKIPGHGKTLNSEVGKDGGAKANSRYLGWQHILEIDEQSGFRCRFSQVAVPCFTGRPPPDP